MVVVPTSHDVTLDYASTGADKVGEAITLAALAGLVAVTVVGWRSRRRSRSAAAIAAAVDAT